MNILHTPHNLINQELNMIIRQLLSLDDVVEVGAHQVGDHVADKKYVLSLRENCAYTSVNWSRLLTGVKQSKRPII